MRTLLEITDDMRALDRLMGEANQALAETEGILDTVDEWMIELDADLEGKVDNYAALIRTLEGRAEIRKAEADRLSHRAKVDERNARWLKTRLLGELQARQIDKIETARFRVSVARNGGKAPVAISDEQAALKAGYVETIERLDKRLCRAHGSRNAATT